MMQKIAAWFTQIFTSPLFLLLAVPVVVALLAIVLKSAARPGRKLSREDFLVGFDLGVTAVVTMLAVAAKAAKELQSLQEQLSTTKVDQINNLKNSLQESVGYVVAAPLFVMLFSLFLFGLSRTMASKGWKAGGNAPSVGWILGIDLIGLILLGSTLFMTGELK